MSPTGDQLLGRVIAGYRLDRVIGAGGAGTVFLARAADPPHSQVAIKLLIPSTPGGMDSAQLADFRARFKREAQTLSYQLHHPNILPVFASGEDPDTGYAYMVMPYMAGGTLAGLIAKGPIPLTDVVAYVDQLGAALDYAHAQGVIHRDIKPANILLDDQGRVYLADFGIAKLLDLSGTTLHTTLTIRGSIIGTPGYLAPEQALNQPVSKFTDIYGLGLVAYQMVTGRMPFSATDLTSMLIEVATEPPVPPLAYRSDLPEPASAVIVRALAKVPTDRFASTGEFARAFAFGIAGKWMPGFLPDSASQVGEAASTQTPLSQRQTQRRFVPPETIGLSQTPTIAGSASARSGPAPRPFGGRTRTTFLALVGAVMLLLLTVSVTLASVLPHIIPLTPPTPTPIVLHPTAAATAHGTSTSTQATTPGVTPTSGGSGVTGNGTPPSQPTPTLSTQATTPPTATPIPLPDLIVSTDPARSTDGAAHDAGNPYFFSGLHNYGNITIEAGAYAAVSSACAGGSGKVQLTATGTVRIDGVLTVKGAGYCGGKSLAGAGGGQQGDSYPGPGGRSNAANGGGGGGGDGADSGGAGGGYGSPGQNGASISNSFGGNTYGDPVLSQLLLGSGGGSSGAQSGGIGGAGGNGGGAISISASTIIVTGNISANGEDGLSQPQPSPTNKRGGGGGSGGSILLHANVLSLGTNLVTATGGQGGFGVFDGGDSRSGGNGGDGRIRLEYTQSLNGTTIPAANIARV